MICINISISRINTIRNTALLGAFAAATGELTLKAASEAVKERLGGQLGEKNALVVQRSYQMVRGKG